MYIQGCFFILSFDFINKTLELFVQLKTSLIRVAFESISPEGLLNDLPVWVEAAQLLHSQDGAHLSELPLVEDDIFLGIYSRHFLG